MYKKKIDTKRLAEYYIGFTSNNLLIPAIFMWISNKMVARSKKAHVIFREMVIISHVFLINVAFFYFIFHIFFSSTNIKSIADLFRTLLASIDIKSTLVKAHVLTNVRSAFTMSMISATSIAFALTILAVIVSYRGIKAEAKKYFNTCGYDIYMCSRQRVMRELSFGIPTLIVIAVFHAIGGILGLFFKNGQHMKKDSKCDISEDYIFTCDMQEAPSTLMTDSEECCDIKGDKSIC
ncbi:hypothetical protein [Candidatus Neoehrlichia procyonis]|nr:hypothetical protein [Candidatus Neoehrlichia lotoris]